MAENHVKERKLDMYLAQQTNQILIAVRTELICIILYIFLPYNVNKTINARSNVMNDFLIIILRNSVRME